jgi:hypothetical protein
LTHPALLDGNLLRGSASRVDSKHDSAVPAETLPQKNSLYVLMVCRESGSSAGWAVPEYRVLSETEGNPPKTVRKQNHGIETHV